MPKGEGLLSSTEAHERLADIEDILGDYYNLDYLRYLVSADVVEVVRCKDCAFSYVKKGFEDNLKKFQEKEGVTICRRLSPYIDFVPLDGYCNAGIKPKDVPSRFWPLDMRSHDETNQEK